MAKQLINLGTVVNDGTGDVLRVGAQKINENFNELYTFLESSNGQLSLVSSIAADEGVTVSSSSGNVLIRANIASTTDLGSIRVGSGLQISEGGVLSIIPQAQFGGDYNDLTNTPDLSVYQLAVSAFNGNYNSLSNKPNIPTSLFNLGIAQGEPGEVLVLNNSNLPEFQTLFNQNLSTSSDVFFNSVTAEEGIALNTSTEATEQAIQSLTAQRDNLQNSVLPGYQQQLQVVQSQLSYWQGVLNTSPPGSPQYSQALYQVQMLSSQVGSLQGQIASIQGQISALSAQISYYQGTLEKTSTSLVFDHISMSLVTDVGITVARLLLGSTNYISANTGISISSSDDLKLTASTKQWSFGTDGVITLPSSGDIVDSSGDSIIPVMPDQTLNKGDDVQFNTVTAESIAIDTISSTGTGIPTLTSATNINLNAASAVVIGTSPLRLASFTTALRDTMIAMNGELIYNTTTNKIQGYQNGVWINLDGTV